MSWDALFAAIHTARHLVETAAPDPETAAEGEGYVGRLVASALGGAMLGHLLRRDGLSSALPCQGGPNPDYLMRFAQVDPARQYRLEGRIDGSERVGVGLYTNDANGALIEAGYAAFDKDFAIDIGEGGDLPIAPGTRVMLTRTLHRDPEGNPARLRFTGGPEAAGLSANAPDGALAFVAQSLVGNVTEYLKWTAVARDYRNRLDLAPPELAATVQGDRDTRYFLGGFDLAEGEWLEVTLPTGIGGYWSLHAYSHWFEHLQTPGADDRNSVADADGRIRIALGPNPRAGMANRIDTRGRRKGALILRIIGADGRPETHLRQNT